MPIAIGSIKQESNSFCAIKMGLEDFKKGYFYCDSGILANLSGSKTGEGGFIDALNEHGKIPVPTLATMPASSSGGVVLQGAYEFMRDGLLSRISDAFLKGNLEGVLLNLHGAMVAEECHDVEGDITERVRDIIGRNIPLAISLDGHANVTQKMLDSCDIIVGYSTFPHIDEYGTGYRAAKLLLKVIDKSLVPTMETVHLPMLLSPETQSNVTGPLGDILGYCRKLETEEGIASVTFFPVQPWLDVPGTASTALVITNGNAQLAKKCAQDIGKLAWSVRQDFSNTHINPNQAVKEAMAAPAGPVVLSEVGDAPPAGSTGDSNCLLRALLEEFDSVTEPALVTVVDPMAVENAFAAGEGQLVRTPVGYSLDPRWGDPVDVEGVVTRLCEGRFTSQQIGTTVSMGKTAVIQIGNIFLVVCSQPFNHIDPNSYIALGLDPSRAKIVGVKSTQHFRAFYGPLAAEIHLLDMPGPSSSKFGSFSWQRLSRPMWPLDDVVWTAS